MEMTVTQNTTFINIPSKLHTVTERTPHTRNGALALVSLPQVWMCLKAAKHQETCTVAKVDQLRQGFSTGGKFYLFWG